MEENLISVVMPAYNAEKFIEQAIQSVLIQKVKLELIIIDDASKDQTENIVKKYCMDNRVIYLKNASNLGVARTRNIGVWKAKGRYIAFLDADDWWEQEKLEKQLALMQQKKMALCYTARKLYSHQGEDLHKIISVQTDLTYQELLQGNRIVCSSVLIKREAALEFPMEHDEYHEDYMVWLKCLKKYKKAYGINEPLVSYRLSKEGKSRNRFKSAKMTYGMHRYMGMSISQALFYTGLHLYNGVKKYWR